MLIIRIVIGTLEIDNTVEINNKIGGIIIIEIEIIIIEGIIKIKIEEIKIIEIILKVDIIKKRIKIKRMINIKIGPGPDKDKEIINIQEDEYDTNKYTIQ